MIKSCWHATGIVIEFGLVDVIDDAIGDVLTFLGTVASHPER
jgi:hypothetical protein